MSLMGPRGQRMVEIGGDRCWVKNGQTMRRIKGDIFVAYQWMDLGGKEPHPCMVLFPTEYKLDAGAYVIPFDNAHLYVSSRGEPTEFLVHSAFNAAVSMGFFPDKSTVHRIIDIVADGIGDLLMMPSTQPTAFDVAATVRGIEATVRANGQVIHQEVL